MSVQMLRDAPLTGLRNCNGNTSQEWRVMADGELINQNSGTCLDDSGNTTTNGTQLQIWNCNGNPQQNWTLP